MARTVRTFLMLSVLAIGIATPLAAQTADECVASLKCENLRCRGGAKPVPRALWGELEPVDSGTIPLGRDNTSWNGFGVYDSTHPYFTGIYPLPNNYFIATLTVGFSVYRVGANGLPTLVSTKDGRRYPSDYPSFPANPESKFPMVAGATSGSFFVHGGSSDVGISVWDLSDLFSPTGLYANDRINVTDVYAAQIGNDHYAYAAAGSNGLRIYNLSAIQRAGLIKCVDTTDTLTCGGGSVASRQTMTAAPVTLSGTAELLGVAYGLQRKGLEIYNISTPTLPRLVTTVANGEMVVSQGMWRGNDQKIYVMARVSVGAVMQVRIYDITCAANGTCGALAPVSSVEIVEGFTDFFYTTISRSGNRIFAYLADNAFCVGGNQKEWLFDVTDPSAPRDVTPPPGVVTAQDNKPYTVGYWGWYYRIGPTGFNYVGGQRAAFIGEYLYRAAFAIFDVHRLTSGTPSADFSYSPSEVYPGTPVTFSDASTGSANSWTWSFSPDATPSHATTKDTSVTFAAAGSKIAQLIACQDSSCSEPAQKTITVLNPQVSLSGIGVSPTAPTACQTVTFTAQVTGRPPLAYNWFMSGPGGSVALACTGNPCSWSTDGSAAAGIYTVSVQVSNSLNANSPAQAAAQFVLSNVQLAFTGPPTADAITGGTVTLHANSAGASEWSWDFDDDANAATANWSTPSSDPVTGPNPSHTYATNGVRAVKVRIRKCGSNWVESAALQVSITNVTPLTAGFEASCFGGFCAFSTNETITFTDTSTGGATAWAYDWAHNTTNPATCSFGASTSTPATTRSYAAAGTYYPCVRVTRGTDSAVFVHGKAIIVTTPRQQENPALTINAATLSLTTGQAVMLTATATDCTPNENGYVWENNGVSSPSTGSTYQMIWASPGYMTVKVTNPGCTGATGQRTFSVSDPNGGNNGGDDGGGDDGGNGGSTGMVASFTMSSSTVTVGQVVSFNAAASTGGQTTYSWDFGDGEQGSGVSPTHAYAAKGVYTVKLTTGKRGDGPGCGFGWCFSEQISKTVTVN